MQMRELRLREGRWVAKATSKHTKEAEQNQTQVGETPCPGVGVGGNMPRCPQEGLVK